MPIGDSSFSVTLAQGDFLSHNGNLHLKNGDIKYGTKVSFIDSALDSAMAITGTDIFVGKGSTVNPNSSQFRIGKLGGTQVEIGSLNNILNQEVTLQVGAAGTSSGTNASGFIKAKQTVLSPPQWNMSLHSYNGAAGSVEALTIAPNGQVTIPNLVNSGPDFDSSKIDNLTAPGIVQLGTYDGGQGGSAAPAAGTTTVWGDLDIRGNITFPGSGSGVNTVNISSTNPTTSLITSQNQNSGTVNLNVSVNTLNEIPLVTEVTSWNNLIGTAGGAAKADKLTTSRLIWGRPFDGTSNVSGQLSNVTTITGTSGANLTLIANDAAVYLRALGTQASKYAFGAGTGSTVGYLSFESLTTVNRFYTLPDADGRIALTSDIPAATNLIPLNNTWTGINTFNNTIVGSVNGNAATASDASKLNNATASVSNIGSRIVQRDGNGNFAAGTVTASLSGNATTCTTASNSNALQGFTSTNGNTGNTIVRRASDGSFSAGTITASLSGNATSVTNGVYTSGAQSIAGVKTFSSTIGGNINGNAATATTASNSNQLQGFTSTNGNTGNTIVRRASNGSFSSGTITTTGIVSTGDIVAFSTSDKRLKDNITPITNALEKVASISGNTFEWNEKSDKEGSETGVIAQEVEALGLPDVVTTRDNGYKAVRYEKLVPLLIEAIKELKIEVEELKR